MTYRLFVDYEVIEFLETLSRGEQRLLRNRFVAIRDNPGKFTDCTETDGSGRRVDIHIYNKYAVKYWQDHADQHIKILYLHFADRAPLK
jgi:hypothetical protein